MFVSLRKNQVNYLGKSLISHKQTIWDDNIVKYRGVSSIEKSPLDRDKSHLCTCMIPNRYFDSPVGLVWPGHPLAPDAPDPLYVSFNHSVISFSQDNKGTIPVSCGAHAVAPHWSLTPPKEQSAIVKLPLNFLHLIKHTRETEEERDLGPVPLSPMSKMAGQLILHEYQCPGLVWLLYLAIQVFCFTIQLS